MLKSFLTLTILFSGITAVANEADDVGDCTYMDQRWALGPVRDQGDIGWCYANTAADLMGHEYYKELNGQQVSAIDIALNFNQSLRRDAFTEGGSGYLALNFYLATQDHVCLQTVENQFMHEGLRIPLKEKLDTINELKDLYDLQHNAATAAAANAAWSGFFSVWENLKKHKSIIFSMGEQKLMQLLANSSRKDLPKNIANALCVGHNSRPLKIKSDLKFWYAEYGGKWLGEDIAMFKLNQQLDRGNIVALAYYGSILQSPTQELDPKSMHMSSIVGRQWRSDTHQCEYLIRNSWGSGCYYKDNPKLRKDACEKGNIWMPEALIRKSMTAISYFDD